MIISRGRQVRNSRWREPRRCLKIISRTRSHQMTVEVAEGGLLIQNFGTTLVDMSGRCEVRNGKVDKGGQYLA